MKQENPMTAEEIHQQRVAETPNLTPRQRALFFQLKNRIARGVKMHTKDMKRFARLSELARQKGKP